MYYTSYICSQILIQCCQKILPLQLQEWIHHFRTSYKDHPQHVVRSQIEMPNIELGDQISYPDQLKRTELLKQRLQMTTMQKMFYIRNKRKNRVGNIRSTKSIIFIRIAYLPLINCLRHTVIYSQISQMLAQCQLVLHHQLWFSCDFDDYQLLLH